MEIDQPITVVRRPATIVEWYPESVKLGRLKSAVAVAKNWACSRELAAAAETIRSFARQTAGLGASQPFFKGVAKVGNPPDSVIYGAALDDRLGGRSGNFKLIHPGRGISAGWAAALPIRRLP